MNKYGQTVGRNFLGRLNTGIHQSIQMAIADKVLIDDFTQHVELFSSKEQQMTEEKYLHTEKDYLDLLLAVKRKFDYQRSIVPYIVYFLLKTGMRFGELVALTWNEVDFDRGLLKTYRRYNTLSHKFVPPKNKNVYSDGSNRRRVYQNFAPFTNGARKSKHGVRNQKSISNDLSTFWIYSFSSRYCKRQ